MSGPERFDVVIVGAGHGGAAAAAALRQRGFAGSIALIGDEAEPPYERPPLSKEYLSGEKPFERLLIRPISFWSDRAVALVPATRIVAVDASAHVAKAADGRSFAYGTLVWATGGSPRRLSCEGHDLAGVHAIRTRADVDRLIGELPAVERVCIVGGGYIGLEAAAVMTKLGKAATLIEAQDRVLSRVAGEALSRFYEAEHRRHGVDLRLGAQVACIEERDGAAVGVRLADGELIACQAIVVGVGIEPAVGPLLDAGAAGTNGVDIDEFGRTTLADVYALGDCAAHRNRFAGGARIRLESVQNANDQAATVARHIVGTPEPYDAVPWFWSNQYDLKLQTIGLSLDHDEVVVRGSPGDRSFSVIYRRDGRIVALDCVNAVRDYVQGKALVLDGSRRDRHLLEDSAISLRG